MKAIGTVLNNLTKQGYLNGSSENLEKNSQVSDIPDRPLTDEEKAKIEQFLKPSINLVPKLFMNSTLENFEIFTEDMREKIDISRNALKKRGLFLSGNTGSGKTHLAFALMKELDPIEMDDVQIRNAIVKIGYYDERMYLSEMLWLTKKRKMKCFYIHIRDLIITLNEALSFESKKNLREVIDEILGYDCVFIDDLGSEKISESSMQNIYYLIDCLYTNQKKIIITSNLSIEDVNAYNPRIASRFSAMCTIVNINFPDYRVEKLAKI